jgi:putative thioredoxin
LSNFGGAIDLSSLAGGGDKLTVSDWLVQADQQTLRSYLKLSEKVPVLLFISDDSEASSQLRKLLVNVLASSDGRFAGLEVSLSSSPQLAQAMGVSAAPAMLALLAGQPAPLFQGEIQQPQLMQVLTQVLQLAAQNSITGRVQVGSAPVQKQLSKEHELAIAAVEAGDLASAKQQFEKLLKEYPNDFDAKAGLAQVELMIRLTSKELGELDQLMLGADQLLVSRDPSGAFGLLLSLFKERIADRDAIRGRMLELFSLFPEGEESVIAARKQLTALLF